VVITAKTRGETNEGNRGLLISMKLYETSRRSSEDSSGVETEGVVMGVANPGVRVCPLFQVNQF
jgi:hypothetical protein|tara:strand:- start:75929 stop:76120 length:192 start_codon:yes stop_codon:yes gene_type:complete